MSLENYTTGQLEAEITRRKVEQEKARKANEKDYVCTECHGTRQTMQRDWQSGETYPRPCPGCNGTGTVRF